MNTSCPPPTPTNWFCTSCADGTCTLSCPLIYSWGGLAWHLGPGTFGGANAPALARIDLDNLLVACADLGLLQFRDNRRSG